MRRSLLVGCLIVDFDNFVKRIGLAVGRIVGCLVEKKMKNLVVDKILSFVVKLVDY